MKKNLKLPLLGGLSVLLSWIIAAALAGNDPTSALHNIIVGLGSMNDFLSVFLFLSLLLAASLFLVRQKK